LRGASSSFVFFASKALALDPTHAASKQAAALLGGLDDQKARAMAAAREAASKAAADGRLAEVGPLLPAPPVASPAAEDQGDAGATDAPPIPPGTDGPAPPIPPGTDGPGLSGPALSGPGAQLAPVAADLSSALDASATDAASEGAEHSKFTAAVAERQAAAAQTKSKAARRASVVVREKAANKFPARTQHFVHSNKAYTCS
jgi:hypothetical protein